MNESLTKASTLVNQAAINLAAVRSAMDDMRQRHAAGEMQMRLAIADQLHGVQALLKLAAAQANAEQ